MFTASHVALAQGFYFLLTGLWPIVDDRSFQRVTGPKTDVWLVKTVGLLIGIIGAGLILAGRRAVPPAESRWMALASAAGLGAVDVVYALQGRISKIYLLDAGAEAGLIAGWLGARRRAA